MSKNIFIYICLYMYILNRVILTPNAPEFDRLVAGAIRYILQGGAAIDNGSSSRTDGRNDIDSNKGNNDSNNNTDVFNRNDMQRFVIGLESIDVETRLKYLCLALGGVTIVRKGSSDMISCGGDVYVVQEEGSMRRCGGQGDILAGCLGVSHYWAIQRAGFLPKGKEIRDILDNKKTTSLSNLPAHTSPENSVGLNGDDSDERVSLKSSCDIIDGDEDEENRARIWGVVLASVITKRASRKAFLLYGRSMTSPDVLEQLGAAFEEITSQEEE